MSKATNCPKCSSDDLLVVKLVPKDRQMLFHTCRHCENRWWRDAEEGVGVPLNGIIEQLSG